MHLQDHLWLIKEIYDIYIYNIYVVCIPKSNWIKLSASQLNTELLTLDNPPLWWNAPARCDLSINCGVTAWHDISSACHLSSKVLVFSIQNYSTTSEYICSDVYSSKQKGEGLIFQTLLCWQLLDFQYTLPIQQTKVLIEWWEEVADNPERLEGKDPSCVQNLHGKYAHTMKPVVRLFCCPGAFYCWLKWHERTPRKPTKQWAIRISFYFSWWVAHWLS